MAKIKYDDQIIGRTYIEAFENRRIKFRGYLYIYSGNSNPQHHKRYKRLFYKILKSLKGYAVRVEDVMNDEL